MANFKKTVLLGRMDNDRGGQMRVFAFIKFENGKLSISGVEGPLRNGDAVGSCGQIDMHHREDGGASITPGVGWTSEMITRFLEVWGRWHLNDMRAYSSEMREAGWHELAKTKMLGYEFTMTDETSKAVRTIKDRVMKAAGEGVQFQTTPEEVKLLAMPYSTKIWVRDGEDEPSAPEGYERSIYTYGHNQGAKKHPESKTLGWLRPTEHPDGLLTRKLNADDEHGYGSKWWTEDVPEDVLDFLRGLPSSPEACPWRND